MVYILGLLPRVHLHKMLTYFLKKYENHYGAIAGLFSKGLTRSIFILERSL